MKIEYIIVQYLYTHKEVALQGIGTFRLNPQVTMPSGNDKDFSIPENAIQFEYNLRTSDDEGLINFIVQHTRKIKSLATSDLESYCTLAKQFLNIGKPLIIEGVGTVQKNMQGEYEFIPGNFVVTKIDEAPKELKEKKEELVSFESESRKKGNNTVTIAIVLLVIALAGTGIYYFIKKKNAQKAEATEQQAAALTIPITDTVKKDTIAKPVVDSNLLKASIVPKDSSTFKIVLKTYPDSIVMSKAYKRLTSYGHTLVIIQENNAYKLAIPFTFPISDTARVRDSVRKFFGGAPYVRL